MNARNTKPVRFVATIIAMPKVISYIPAIIKEEITTFATDVKDELNYRKVQADAAFKTIYKTNN